MAAFFVPFSFAHGEGGAEKEINGLIIDVGYDPNPLIAGKESSFSIGLANASTEMPVDVDKIWLRLSTPEQVVYAGTHLPENGFAPLSIVLPKAGEYTLSVRFYKDGEAKSLASADFSLQVKGTSSSLALGAFGVIFFLLGILAAGIIGYIIWVAKHKRKKLK